VVLALSGRQVNNDWMEYLAKVASSVLFVTELDRSVNFYRDLFGCEVSLRSEGEAALLLAPGGFQLYIIERGRHAEHHPGGLGHHLLMWATDSREGLSFFEQALKDAGRYTGTHSAGEVTFVEGRDPDGIRVVVAHPDPAHRPRSVFDSHLYT
jgi:catechol 2,3-dioxygenase-like lactoylglutathione lyase family enzyme